MDKQKKKSKNTIKALFAFLAILILVLVGATVYFYLTGEGDFFDTGEEETVTCACYYIDPEVTTTCGDTKRGFKFNTSEGLLGECSTSCPTTELSTDMLYSNSDQDDYLTCSLTFVENTQCSSMEVKTEDGLIVTGKISPDVPIVVTATFDSADYSNHKFLINNVPTEPDSVNETTASISISDYEDASTLLIVAQAENNVGDTVGSEILCKRLIEITTTAEAGVSNLAMDTYTASDGLTKIKSTVIKAGGLDQEAESRLEFSFEEQTLTMNNGFEVNSTSGEINIDELDLYDSNNFSGSSFEVLNNYTGEIEVTVEVFQNDTSLGTATTTITIEEPVDTGEDPGADDEDTDDPPIDEEPATESAFSVTKTSSMSCVERVSPDNRTEFTLTITNNGENTDTIESVKDKLPLGFSYIAESSTLDGNAISDSIFVTTTQVGDSQEIVWEPENSWSIPASGSITIAFEASIGENALSGENLNEVIVTPTELPAEPSTLRASSTIIVAQDCDNIDLDDTPQTGIFDTTLGRIVAGLFITLIGVIIYKSNQGTQLANMIIHSGPYRDAEMASYKVFKPKKYFEEKILERRERER
ncbi:MAG: protein of unknown function DUF11 [candidate division WS6 bacterium 34_10]|uniref:DUF11 domain-containing protein n=1 Tax=candidate division WS6 bacterium 34_10 TaxID=1641389 RepID=A0A101HI18_9BACT|nr:MAG: protein of unknown function DUF11 [candidate division WS6 bacterium 34_10]